MIDSKTLVQEVKQAKAARRDAEDACCALEELLWEIGRGPRAWRRLAQVDGEADAGEAAPLTH
jgi:hypothetical protein